MSVWKSDETLLSICILNFSFKNDFVWEEISNIRHSVSSPDETPRSSSKILRCASYFQLSSRCFIWWWNTASHVWYITWSATYQYYLFVIVEWYWKVWLCPWLLRITAVLLFLLSVTLVWSEVTFFNNEPVLSIFALMIDGASVGYYYFYVEVCETNM